MGALLDAAMNYADSGFARFHMPGHKGAALPYPGFGKAPAIDLTEIAGLDSLYTASDVIHKVEQGYTKLYGALESFISAGGSTLCIQAMLALATKPGDKILITRGAHVASVNAMALLDLHPQWLLPEPCPQSGLAQPITAQQVRLGLEAHPDAVAVYITSPTFFGVMADIAGTSKVCREFEVPLLVDGAHGAHLPLFEPNLHPIALGASICCDSLHKTLPVLTGGALLNISREEYTARAREKLALFGSTSPSYLVMASICGALDYLTGENTKREVRQTAERIAEIAEKARKMGYLLPQGQCEPLRLTLSAAPLGYTGEELGEHLRGQKVEPEYAGGGFCVLMASPFNAPGDFERLQSALESLPPRQPLALPSAHLTLPGQAMSIRQAVFSAREVISVDAAIGRVAGTLVAPCPPGIALVSAGERIDAQTIHLLKSYGICTLSVVQ